MSRKFTSRRSSKPSVFTPAAPVRTAAVPYRPFNANSSFVERQAQLFFHHAVFPVAHPMHHSNSFVGECIGSRPLHASLARFICHRGVHAHERRRFAPPCRSVASNCSLVNRETKDGVTQIRRPMSLRCTLLNTAQSAG